MFIKLLLSSVTLATVFAQMAPVMPPGTGGTQGTISYQELVQLMATRNQLPAADQEYSLLNLTGPLVPTVPSAQATVPTQNNSMVFMVPERPPAAPVVAERPPAADRKPNVLPSMIEAAVQEAVPQAVETALQTALPTVVKSVVEAAVPKIGPPPIAPAAIQSLVQSAVQAVVPSAVQSAIKEATPKLAPSPTTAMSPAALQSAVQSAVQAALPSVLQSAVKAATPTKLTPPSTAPPAQTLSPAAIHSVIQSAVKEALPSAVRSVVQTSGTALQSTGTELPQALKPTPPATCRGSCPPKWISLVHGFTGVMQPDNPMCRFRFLISPCSPGSGQCQSGYSCCPTSCLDTIKNCYMGPPTEAFCLPNDVTQWWPQMMQTYLKTSGMGRALGVEVTGATGAGMGGMMGGLMGGQLGGGMARPGGMMMQGISQMVGGLKRK